MYSICTQYILTVRRRSEGKTSGRHVIVTPFYLPCRLGSARALTDSRPLRCRLSLGLSPPPHDRPGKTNEGAGCGWASFRLPSPRDVAATLLSLCLSSTLRRGALARRSGTRRSHSQSQSRQVRVWGQETEESRTEAEPTTKERPNYHFACSARRLPRHAPCPSSLLPRIEPRHHSILATEHPASRSMDRSNVRTCIGMYTVSIFIRAVLFAGPYVTWRAVA